MGFLTRRHSARGTAARASHCSRSRAGAPWEEEVKDVLNDGEEGEDDLRGGRGVLPQKSVRRRT